MTYLQFMTKCLNFFKDDNNKFDSYDFYYHWLRNEDDDVENYYKDQAKKAIMYLFLLETKKTCDKDTKFLKFLEKELAYSDISICKTIEKAKEKTEERMYEDPYLCDRLLLLELDELTIEETTNIFREYVSGVHDEVLKGFEVAELESAIHTVMEIVSQIIPELFFTEKGYKYIDKEYQIDDEELREKCYEYLKANIGYYNDERIYKVDENLYDSDSYRLSDDDEIDDEEENDYDQDDCFDEEDDEEDYICDVEFLDDDELRSEVDIYCDDVDNYDILFYSTTLLFVVLRLVRNKEYTKLNKLIELDESMTNSYNSCSICHDKTVIEAFYQPKSMGRDYRKEISIHPKGDYYLDFFLSDNELTRQYGVEELASIICYCFDYYADDPIGKITNSIDKINSVLGITSQNAEKKILPEYERKKEKIKQFYMIRTNSN